MGVLLGRSFFRVFRVFRGQNRVEWGCVWAAQSRTMLLVGFAALSYLWANLGRCGGVFGLASFSFVQIGWVWGCVWGGVI